MGFLKRLFGPGATSSSSDFFTFKVRCDRCGEIIEGKVNLSNDLSLNDEGEFFARKVLIGSERCFQRIEVTLKFDSARNLTEKQANAGQFAE